MPKGQSLYDWCKENNKEYLLKEWDTEENAKKGWNTKNVACKCNKLAHWICKDYKHPFDAYVGNRTRRGDNCPYCSDHRLWPGFNDLEWIVPNICKEWDYEENLKKHNEDVDKGVDDPHPAIPSQILWGSKTKVYWKCKKGHTSFKSPNERHTKKDGSFSACNICADETRAKERRKTRSAKNKLAELVPESINEWVDSENHLTPFDVSCHSKELVHWKCKRGHEFDKRVTDRVTKENGKLRLRRCGECTKYARTSIAEQIIYYYVKKVFPDTINTYKRLGFEIDVFIPSLNIGIEYDGSYYHKNTLEKDNIKDTKAIEKGIQLYRFRPEMLPDTIASKRITIEEDNQGVVEGLKEFFSLINVDVPDIDFNRDYNEICSLFKLRTGRRVSETELIKEWDYDLNTIDPSFISEKETKIQVYWKCTNPESDHPSFLSSPYNRSVRHTHCPICSNSKALRKRKKVRNIETGEVFESISAAEMKYGKPGNTSISNCCRKKTKTAYGYHWEYV